MSHRVPKFAGWVVGVFAALALTFGATVAFAKPVYAFSCQDDGWNFLGEQPSQMACTTACMNLHPDLVSAQWGPVNHCCRCLF